MIQLPDLPVREYLPNIAQRLRTHKILVLEAEPGAGKTTLVPPGLLNSGFLSSGRLDMLEPRRVAALQSARRIADILGEGVGQTCGYRVRGDHAVSSRTKIEIITEALLVRQLQADPSLGGVSVVILDEFHERSIHADLALAFLMDSLSLRDDLRVVIMSATMQTERLQALFARVGFTDADYLSVPGRCFPVDKVYFPLPQKDRFSLEFARNLLEVFSETKGDILAFLPGRGEIEQVGRALELVRIDADILPLHGSLPLQEQSRVVNPTTAREDKRRIILSTNIAETSLTVPGITVVADSGLERVNRLHLPTGMDTLVLEKISNASAEQRAGRAGRLGPGTAYRFWPRGEARADFSQPEISRADISGLTLEALLWGVRAPTDLALLDPPEPGAWKRSLSLLSDLGLASIDGQPGPEAKRVMELGLGPRLGTLVLRHPTPLAAAMAALLGDRDASGLEGEADFRLRLDALRVGHSSNRAWLQKTRQEFERILSLLKLKQSSWTEEEEAKAGDYLVAAFPDRVCRRLENGDRYRFVGGREARLLSKIKGGAAGALAAEEWLVAAEVDSGVMGQGLIRLACPLSASYIEKEFLPKAEDRFAIEWEGLSPRPRSGLFIGKLEIGKASRKPDTAQLSAQISQSFVELLAESGWAILPQSDGLVAFLARARFFAAHGAPQDFPALDEASLIGAAAEWLTPYLDIREKGNNSGVWYPVLDEERLSQALRSLLSPWRAQIEKAVPDHVDLPSGRSCRVNYADEASPFIESKLQDFYGLTAQPMAGNEPIVIKLLSPARRPVQITSDIGGFWKSSYAEVRKELRGRYPKHPWPEDGGIALPQK
jgi:ATP-dependent helicase HrpB